jgi:hypothetical protein
MLAAHVSRTDDKGAGVSGTASDLTTDDAGDADEASGVKSTSAFGFGSAPPPARQPPAPADESERARLIAELAKLLREPALPESTRVAGLTLIGWLARRRLDESPHAIGIEEARQSERRLRTGRSRVR